MFSSVPLVQVNSTGSRLEAVISRRDGRCGATRDNSSPRWRCLLDHISALVGQAVSIAAAWSKVAAAEPPGICRNESWPDGRFAQRRRFHAAGSCRHPARLGLDESALQCGLHPVRCTRPPALGAGNTPGTPSDVYTKELPGKHSGCWRSAWIAACPSPITVSPPDSVQVTIKQTLAETDGCDAGFRLMWGPMVAACRRSPSAFAAALAFVRLADPSSLSEPRRSALRRIASA